MKRKINHCFASALYQGRIKSDMKQQAVADFLGRTKRWYQKIESGESEPDLNDTLCLMAKFQINAAEIVKEADGDVPVSSDTK